MSKYKQLGLAIVVGSLLVAGPVAAQDYGDASDQSQQGDQDTVTAPEEQEPMAQPEGLEEPYEEPAPMADEQGYQGVTAIGLGLTIGGGVNGFTDGDFNDFVDIGGGWEGRLAVGTRTVVGFEASYVGTANSINAPGLSSDATLLANGVNGAFRLNLSPTMVKPYILAGAGWKHYSVQNTSTVNSDIQDSDDVIEFPLGAGLSYNYNRFIADVRGTFTPVVDDELFRSAVGNDNNKLNTWKAAANIGFEF